ncbi:unnamed protein product [Schistosoma mattheei]|uniref:Uncharacterized protein n=1 Tax=Schistosoma mattheei TaxID=31246 RepID=A0A3P8ES09_9TREM|nr:unnamed protein product [Schistosoma mattheei]
MPVIAFASALDLPCSSMILPRGLQDFISYRVSSSSVIGLVLSMLYLKILLFSLCI